MFDSFLATAQAHMHERRMQHRDLKPDNVLFDGDENAYACACFGVSA